MELTIQIYRVRTLQHHKKFTLQQKLVPIKTQNLNSETKVIIPHIIQTNFAINSAAAAAQHSERTK